ncbi:methyl-accepting chemotaxis sensory transducer [Magnetococcus marinus MC-1]|uniref:Methyl-accepting chemotaxis sensory transducer n=1 Tax=Magnetococcus marinus (strain ATCC BAA-1437 / JCM 17883 / MC-1) TaxID=156889 RepID=A0L584_MAGMM|nr:bacteriohemerythrin [Magnetococcus marinus]ABK43127.1 methyl-accepting chemotaxis sensory transducer [Magnetococcus marinus MC-1]
MLEKAAWTKAVQIVIMVSILLVLGITVWSGQQLRHMSLSGEAQSLVTWSMVLVCGLIGLLSMGLLVLRQQLQRQQWRLNQQLDVLTTGDLTHRVDLDAKTRGSGVEQQVGMLTDQLDWVLRIVKLQARSVAAVVQELGPLREQLYKDSHDSKALSWEVTRENDRLDQEIQQLNQHVGEAQQRIVNVAGAVESLAQNITEIAQSAQLADVNVSTMASAAEEMTSNIDQVRSLLGRVNDSVSQVSGAIGGLNLSLNDVRSRCQTADGMSAEANQLSHATREVMRGLAGEAAEVYKAVKTIRNIADQTNMLALNAAIESAGAGEAGKGFAVVANEVKALAAQTGEATNMIESRIQQMQASTEGAVQATRKVDEVINSLAKTNQAITDAVDDQAAGVDEISRSIESVTFAADEVTRNTSELSVAAQEVARSALEAAQGTRVIAETASHLAELAEEVARQSELAQRESDKVQLGAKEIFSSSVEVQKRMIQSIRLMDYLHGSVEHAGFLTGVIDATDVALRDAVRGYHTPPEPFDVQGVKQAHLAWLGKLEQVIRGRIAMRAEEMASGRQCAFGLWYYSEGETKFSHLPIFQELGEVHLKVHEMAKEVVTLANQQELEAAVAGMQRFDTLRGRLFDMLDQLYMVAEMAIAKDTQPNLMPWNSHLVIGVAQMDKEHSQLVALINQLYHTILEGGSSKQGQPVLEALMRYTQDHFKHEEALLKQMHYPDLQAHMAEHRALIEQVQHFQQDFERGQASINLRLVGFLKDWLSNHILGSDKPYGTYVR